MPIGDISDVKPRVDYANWRTYHGRTAIWPMLVQDDSAYFRNGGTQLRYPVDNTNYGPANDQSGDLTPPGNPALQASVNTEDTTALTAETPTQAGLKWPAPSLFNVGYVDLNINKRERVRMLLPYEVDQRIIPSYMGRVTQRIVEEERIKESRYLRDTIFAGITGDSLLVSGANRAITVATGSWGDAAHQTAVFELLERASYQATKFQWPKGSRTLVVGPRNYGVIVKHLIQQNLYIPTRDAMGRAYVDGETIGVWGWNIREDADIDIGVGATDDDLHDFYFLSERMGVAYASDLRRLRFFESEEFEGWLTQGIFTYGAAVINPRYQMLARTTITA